MRHEVMQIHAVMTDSDEELPPTLKKNKSNDNTHDNEWWKDHQILRSNFLREKLSRTANTYKKQIKILKFNCSKKEKIIADQKKLIFKLKKKNRAKKLQILKLCDISDSSD